MIWIRISRQISMICFCKKERVKLGKIFHPKKISPKYYFHPPIKYNVQNCVNEHNWLVLNVSVFIRYRYIVM